MRLIYDKEYKIVLNLDLISVVYIKNYYTENKEEYTYYKAETPSGAECNISEETYEKIKEIAQGKRRTIKEIP